MTPIDEICAIEQACFREYWHRQSISDYFSDKNVVIHIHYEADKAVGFVLGTAISAIKEGELFRIAVLPAYQGQGIGGKLVKRYLQSCRERNIEQVFLEVRESNHSAIALYEKNNFKSISIRKNYYENPIENALIMVCDLATEYFIDSVE